MLLARFTTLAVYEYIRTVIRNSIIITIDTAIPITVIMLLMLLTTIINTSSSRTSDDDAHHVVEPFYYTYHYYRTTLGIGNQYQ